MDWRCWDSCIFSFFPILDRIATLLQSERGCPTYQNLLAILSLVDHAQTAASEFFDLSITR